MSRIADGCVDFNHLIFLVPKLLYLERCKSIPWLLVPLLLVLPGHQQPYYKLKYRCFCLQIKWRHNKCDGVSNYRRLDCLLNRLFSCRWKKTSKLCVTGLCEGNPLVTSGFPSQRASNVQFFSIWWCHHIWEWISTIYDISVLKNDRKC